MMIRRVRLGLLVVGVVLLQTALFPTFRLAGVVPDVGLVVTVAVAYRSGPETGSLFGFATGLSLDLFLQTPVGVGAIAFALTGYLVGVLQTGLLRTTWWISPVLGGLGGLIGGLLFLGIGILVGQQQLLHLRSLRIVGLAALYDALLSPFLFPIVFWAVRDPSPRTSSFR